jgi:hypothetical protein
MPGLRTAFVKLLIPRQTAFTAPGKCGVLAQQRLNDAQLMGRAEGYEKAIFDHNYQACLKVEAAAYRPQP